MGDRKEGRTQSPGADPDPIRNPVPIPPAQDVEYPAVPGPIELPSGVPREGLNPSEVATEEGPRRQRRVEVLTRRRPAGSTKKP